MNADKLGRVITNTMRRTNATWGRAGGALALAALLAAGCARPYVKEQSFAFEAEDIYGNRVALTHERFAGKVVLIDIWGAWCPPCLEQIPHLIEWQERYGGKGFAIIGVEFASYAGESPEEYVEGLRGWIEEKGINYTIVHGGTVRDVNEVFPDLRNFQGFPTSIFIGRDGRVREVKSGFFESEERWYERTIERLLAESPSAEPAS